MELLELEAKHDIKASTGEHIIGFSTDKELILSLTFKGNTSIKLVFATMVKGRDVRSRPEGSILPSELPTPTDCSI